MLNDLARWWQGVSEQLEPSMMILKNGRIYECINYGRRAQGSDNNTNNGCTRSAAPATIRWKYEISHFS